MTTASETDGENGIALASVEPMAALPICRKPSSAEAEPAWRPNGCSAIAVPSGSRPVWEACDGPSSAASTALTARPPACHRAASHGR